MATRDVRQEPGGQRSGGWNLAAYGLLAVDKRPIVNRIPPVPPDDAVLLPPPHPTFGEAHHPQATNY